MLLASVAGILIAAAFPERILAGDAALYRERMSHLFSGEWPYLEFDFEHLPGAIVPMAAAWILGGSSGQSAYVIAFALVSALLLALTCLALFELEGTLGKGLAARWVLAVLPLLPFLLFRNDPWSVLLMVAALWAASTRPGQGSVLAWTGVITKLWPAVWAVVEWWRGKRMRAGLTVLLAVAMLVLLRSDPVMRIQRPSGVHSETLAGSVLSLSQIWSGASPNLVETSALYLEAPWWAHLINVVPAGAVAVLVLSLLGRELDWRRAWLATGSLVGVTMIASPLFSTQYVAWLTPFAAYKPLLARLMLGTNVLSFIMIFNYQGAVNGQLLWFMLALARNALLLTLLIFMVIALKDPGSGAGSDQAATSPIL